MQLMREQVQQEEQRERMQQQAVMHYIAAAAAQQQQQQLGGPPTPAINTPVHFQSPPPVPGEVLKVQSYLENPTSYHRSSPGPEGAGVTCPRPTGTSSPPTSAPAQGSPKPLPGCLPGGAGRTRDVLLSWQQCSQQPHGHGCTLAPTPRGSLMSSTTLCVWMTSWASSILKLRCQHA
ncbi:transcription factor EB-like [Lynx canadensis]|uniref:transcription factor EB-like n=1 Tax=Lynx canadensis TaxID=61383 RepID=UPI0013C5374B|nr:transcription factor EB-like [Lynx canadensis]